MAAGVASVSAGRRERPGQPLVVAVSSLNSGGHAPKSDRERDAPQSALLAACRVTRGSLQCDICIAKAAKFRAENNTIACAL